MRSPLRPDALDRAALAEVEVLGRGALALDGPQDAGRVGVGEHGPAVEVVQRHAPVHARLHVEQLLGERAQRDRGPHDRADLAAGAAHRDQERDDRLSRQRRASRSRQMGLPARDDAAHRLAPLLVGLADGFLVGLAGRPDRPAGVVHVDRVDAAPLGPHPVLELVGHAGPVAPLDQARQHRAPGQLAGVVLDAVQVGRADRAGQVGGRELAAQDVVAQALAGALHDRQADRAAGEAGRQGHHEHQPPAQSGAEAPEVERPRARAVGPPRSRPGGARGGRDGSAGAQRVSEHRDTGQTRAGGEGISFHLRISSAGWDTIAKKSEGFAMGVYEELGVKRLINGWGPMTIVGGSRMRPEVRRGDGRGERGIRRPARPAGRRSGPASPS